MENSDRFLSLMNDVTNALVSDDVIERWLLFQPWEYVYYGKPIDIYPVTFWKTFVDIGIKSDRNYFGKAIERIVSKFDYFKSGEFIRGNNLKSSCIRFYFTDEFAEHMCDIRKDEYNKLLSL